MKSIYHYLSYRVFLQDFYNYKKDQNCSFSYRYFSQKMGIKSSNFLPWLIEGKRDLSKVKIPRLSELLELSSEETLYVSLLVDFEHAKSNHEKDTLFAQIIKHRRAHVSSTVDEMEYELFSHWYYDAIRHLLNITTFNPSQKNAFRRLGRQLRPQITESEARKAVRALKKLELIHLNSHGNFVLSKKLLTTGSEVSNFYVKKYHKSMIDLACDAIENFPSEERDISAVSMAVSQECYEDIKKEVQDLRKRIMERVSRDSGPTTIYELTMQLFPIARNCDEN